MESETTDKALLLFWARGFAGATTRELESFLGLSQSSLYNHYGSKQQLLEAALDRYEELTSEALVQPLVSDADGFRAIKKFFRHLATWVTQDGRRGCMLINLMAEDGDSTPAIKARTLRYRNQVRSALAGALTKALGNQRIPVREIESKADLLLALVLGLNIAVRGGGDEDELEELLVAVSLLLDSWR